MGLHRPTREHDIEDYACAQAQRMGGIALKFKTPPRVGAPDRIVILPGPRIGWLELKRPKGGKFEAGQPRYHAMLRGYGCIVIVCRTRAQVDAALAEIARTKPLNEHPPYVLDELLR